MTSFEARANECLALFSEARDKEGRALSMHSVAIDGPDGRVVHNFSDVDPPADLRSVSKVVVGLVLGALIEREVDVSGDPLTLETRALPLLSRHIKSDAARQQWEAVRVLDLLNNTIGHQEGFLFRKDLGDRDEADYLDYVFGSAVEHSPGSHFSYSNVGPFLFSVIVQDWLGRSLHDLADELVLGPLGIAGSWRSFGDYTAGCTGLAIPNADLNKLARLVRDGGSQDGAQIVSRDWVQQMSAPISVTPGMHDPARVLPKFAYGLGLWVCENGWYYCDGTNGQYLIVLRDRGIAITTTGDQPDMKPITRCLTPFTA